MKHWLTAQRAANGSLCILTLIVLVHLLILTGILPFEIVWGGRLQSHRQMLRFETVSIILNLLMLAVTAVAAGRLRVPVSPRLIQGALWLMAALFLVNTVGNLWADTQLERLLFTPLTLLLALCSGRLAMSLGKAAGPAASPGA